MRKFFRSRDPWPTFIVLSVAVAFICLAVWPGKRLGNMAKNVINKIEATERSSQKKDGVSPRGYLGIEFGMVPEKLLVSNDIPQGAVVLKAIPGCPARDAGIKAGDIITKINGKSFSSFLDVISAKHPGDVVSVEILRDGKTFTLSITLAERPDSD